MFPGSFPGSLPGSPLGSSKKRWLSGLLCLPLLASSGVVQAQSSPDRGRHTSSGNGVLAAAPSSAGHEYWRLMALGLEEYDAGRWAEARALFLRGHELLPNARSLRVLGMTAFNLKLYPTALRELSAALVDVRRPLAAGLRSATKELIDRANTFVGLYHVRLEPVSAQLRVDGAEAVLESDGSLLLAVGEHTLELEAPGHASMQRALVVDGTDGGTLRFQLRSVPRTASAPVDLRVVAAATTLLETGELPARGPVAPPRRKWQARVFGDYRWTWMLGSSALAFGTAATVFRVQTLAEAQRIEDQCQGMCRPSDDVTEQRDKLSRRTEGALAGALVLAVSTLVVFLIEYQYANGTSDEPGQPGGHASKR